MHRRHACALVLGLLAAPVAALAADAPARIVVAGKHPGPGLWKVSQGDHVMWVFGLYAPLPQEMAWDSARVERLVAQSQEVLAAPFWRFGASLFHSLGALPARIGIRRNPGDATLRDVLPPEVHARWLVLKARYIGDDDGIERYRPVFAAEALRKAALKKHALVQSGEIEQRIETLARRNGVKLTQTGIKVTLDDPRRDWEDFRQSRIDDAACFADTLARLDEDLDALRARASAWAEGNMAVIGALDFGRRHGSCSGAILDGAFVGNNPQLQGLGERVRMSWLKAAEAALANNRSTFAMLQMGDLSGPDGYLAALQARGFTVDNPK